MSFAKKPVIRKTQEPKPCPRCYTPMRLKDGVYRCPNEHRHTQTIRKGRRE